MENTTLDDVLNRVSITTALCAGLRPEAHAAMAAIVNDYEGSDLVMLAVTRRILERYDIVVSTRQFVEELGLYIEGYLDGLKHVYRDSSDPEVDAIRSIMGFYIVTHPRSVRDSELAQIH